VVRSVRVAKKVVHGDDLLYRFFEDGLRERPDVFREVPELLITSVAVWLPVEVYHRWPVLLPWVVRDPSCRGNPHAGIPDQWSAPNDAGFLRDDNSLIKAIPRSLAIVGPRRSRVDGARMGSEFVASHVWRMVSSTQLASRIPLLNSFIPNLVWLPSQVAKLTDREGGVVQSTLQAMARRIYEPVEVRQSIRHRVAEAWSMIPEPAVVLGEVSVDRLNWFVPTEHFYNGLERRLRVVLGALSKLDETGGVPDRVISHRYAAGLPQVAPLARTALRQYLDEFAR
jgi:hypothetical protein